MRHVPRSLPVLAAALAVVSGCEVASDDEAAPALPLADHDVAALLYAGAPRTPAGFLADDPPAGFAQVTTYHLKSHQLAVPVTPSYELCTDDWRQAFAWSEEVAVQSSPYLDFVGNQATARYFELDRVPRGQPDRYVRMRVFRCAYLDRAGVDSSAGAGVAGTLNVRPLDAAALRELSEYLWRFTLYNNVDHAVLASEPVGSGLAHTLTIASLERGTNGGCDRVKMRAWRHTADVLTGGLELADTVVREFGVRRDGVSISAC
jgi:hypothetical protein